MVISSILGTLGVTSTVGFLASAIGEGVVDRKATELFQSLRERFAGTNGAPLNQDFARGIWLAALQALRASNAEFLKLPILEWGVSDPVAWEHFFNEFNKFLDSQQTYAFDRKFDEFATPEFAEGVHAAISQLSINSHVSIAEFIPTARTKCLTALCELIRERTQTESLPVNFEKFISSDSAQGWFAKFGVFLGEQFKNNPKFRDLYIVTELNNTSELARFQQQAMQNLQSRFDDLNPQIAGIASHVEMLPEIDRKISEICRRLSPSAETLLTQLATAVARWFDEIFNKPEVCRKRFGDKPIALANAITRNDAIKQISDSFDDLTKLVIILHGEEGTGKTVVLGQWLKQRLRKFPYVVLATAQQAQAWQKDPLACVHAAMQKLHPSLVSQLDNTAFGWLSNISILVVVDGINEVGEATHWIELAQSFLMRENEDDVTDRTSQSEAVGNGQVRLLVTTRTEHFERTMKRELASYENEIGYCEVQKYSDSELDELLKFENVHRNSFHESALTWLRHPRYFARVLTLQHCLEPGAEISPALLRFYDWKEHMPNGSALSEQQFADLLEGYARTARASGTAAKKRSELWDEFSDESETSFQSKIESLLQTRILIVDAGALKLSDTHLSLALGLLLFEQLQQSSHLNRVALRELASSWLGDEQEDARAAICAAAAAKADMVNAPASIKLVIFERWMRCFNREEGLRWFTLGNVDICLDLVEWVHDEGDQNELDYDNDFGLSELMRVLLNHAVNQENSFKTPCIQRIYRWLGQCDSELNRRYSDVSDMQIQEQFLTLLAQAQKLDPGITKRVNQSDQLRDLAVITLQFHTQYLHPEIRRRLLLSFAVDSHYGNSAEWLIRLSKHDWLPDLISLRQESINLPELNLAISTLGKWLWPVEGTKKWKEATEQTYYSAHNPDIDLLDPSIPKESEIDAMVERDNAKTSPFQLNSDLITGFALHRPIAFDRYLDEAITLLTSDTDARRLALGSFVTRCGPLFNPSQRKKLRQFVKSIQSAMSRELKRLEDQLSVAINWNKSGVRRAALIVRRTDWGLEYSRQTLIDDLGVNGTQFLFKAFLRANDHGVLRKLAFALIYVGHLLPLDRGLLAEKMGRHTATAMDELTRKWLVILAWRNDVAFSAVHLIPANWRFADDKNRYPFNSFGPGLAYSGCLDEGDAKVRLNFADLLRVVGPARTNLLRTFEVEVKRLVEVTSPSAAESSVSSSMTNFLQIGNLPWFDLPTTATKKVIEANAQLHEEILHNASKLRTKKNVYDALMLARIVAELRVKSLHPAASAAVRCVWIAEHRLGHYSSDDWLPLLIQLAFQLTDTAANRVLWVQMVRELRDDEMLTVFVAAALFGNGRQWLKEHAQLGLTSNIASTEVSAAVIAGTACFDDLLSQVRLKSDSAHGWRLVGFKHALELARRFKNANIWYQRFWYAENWYTALGAWRAFVALVDVRHLVWKTCMWTDGKQSAALGQHRYELQFKDEVKSAAEWRQKILGHTLFGANVPKIGWFGVRADRTFKES